MPIFNAVIGGKVAGDDLDVRRTVTGIPTAQTMTKAWLTLKRAVDDADPGLLQKVITPAPVGGVGHIVDDGTGDGAGELLFQLTAANTLALPVNQYIAYDIKVLTSGNKIYTVEQGRYSSVPRLTQATS